MAALGRAAAELRSYTQLWTYSTQCLLTVLECVVKKKFIIPSAAAALAPDTDLPTRSDPSAPGRALQYPGLERRGREGDMGRGGTGILALAGSTGGI